MRWVEFEEFNKLNFSGDGETGRVAWAAGRCFTVKHPVLMSCRKRTQLMDDRSGHVAAAEA